MQIIVIKQDTDALIAIEVPSDADAELLIQMIQAEMGIPLQEQRLEMEGVPIRGGSLAAQGVVDGSAIVVRQESAGNPAPGAASAASPVSSSTQQPSVQSPQAPSAAPARQQQLIDPGSVAPERLLEIVRENPQFLVQYKRLDPELGTVIEEGDAAKLRVFIMKRAMSRHKVVYEAKMEEEALYAADPMDPEVQKKIAEKVLDTALDNT